jgi:hypothetical protein
MKNSSYQNVAWAKLTMVCEKHGKHWFMNFCRLMWRNWAYGMSSKLIGCLNVSYHSAACLNLDVPDLNKTGFAKELISRVWLHVENGALLDSKGLIISWWDDLGFLTLDFYHHLEACENGNFTFGLKPQRVRAKYQKECIAKYSSSRCVLEADLKLTVTDMGIIRRAMSRIVPFWYVFLDSCLMSGKMIRFVLSLPEQYNLDIGEMKGPKYRFQDQQLSANELCVRLSRKKKSKRLRSLHMTCIQVNVYVHELPVCQFFDWTASTGLCHFLLSINLDLVELKAYHLYAKRWTIEVLKEAKHHFWLNDYQSRVFETKVTHASVILIAFSMYCTAKRFIRFETMVHLFQEIAGQMTELTVWENFCVVTEELHHFDAKLMEIDFASLVQNIMLKCDQESKLLRIRNFSNSNTA